MYRLEVWIYFLSLLYGVHPIGGNEQCSGLSLPVNPGADVKFSVITTIRRTTDGIECGGSISPTAIQNIAAIQWVVDRMNKNNFTKGIKIGFDVYDDCGIPRKAMARALDLLDGPLLGSPECETSSEPCNIGIIGGSESSTTESILYALRGSQLPVIGPYATYYNLTRYTDYYRTISTDIHQIQATAKLLQQLGLTYVAVVHTDDDFGRFSANTLKDISKANGVCVDNIVAIKTGPDINKHVELLKQQREKTKHNSLRVVYFGTNDIYNKMQTELGYHKDEVFNISWIVVENPEDVSPPVSSTSGLENGTIIVSRKVNTANDIDNYLNEKWNMSIDAKDDLEQLIRCTGEDSVPNLAHNDISSTIDAVFVFVGALQRLANFFCSGFFCSELRRDFKFQLKEVQNYPVIYRDINETVTVQEFAEKDRRVNFNDVGEFLPDDKMALYDMVLVTGQNSFIQIGSYYNNNVKLEDQFEDNLPSTICYTDCDVCDDNQDITFAFVDGDTFLLGIFAVHEKDPDDPFRCSKFRTSQMDVIIIETFMYSVEQMRNETGINFGAIAIDDCYSSAQTELVLSQIMSGEVTLTNPYTGDKIDVNRIAAVVMTVSSSVTIPVGFLMTELKIPVISASASSPDLDDRINFPYFLRTVPSDIEQARALINIIKQMGWKYVSVLYVENNYGSKGKETFAKLANESGICIADSPEAISDVKDDNSESELLSVLTRLRNQRADVVVYFGTETRIADFLQVVNEESGFIFLASEEWGDRQYILDIGQRRTLGSVTLKNHVESLSGNPMAEYIRKLNPDHISSQRNPWFVEYWEEYFQCDLPQSFRHRYDKACDETTKFNDDNILDFAEDQRIVHTVFAIRALTNGLKKAQNEFCNPNLPNPEGNVFPCQKYFQYITNVVQYIREIELNRGGKSVRVFKDDGNGNIGFIVNNIQEGDGSELVYKRVGSYEEGQLTLQKNELRFYRSDLDGACPGALCGHCSNASFTTAVTMATTTPSSSDTDKFTIPDFTVIGILAFLFLTILIVCIIISCYFKNRIRELETQLKETKYEIRTGYALHSTSSFSHANTTSVTYPDLKFANTSPSGDTMYEWSKAQNVLNGGNSRYRQPNGGVVNQGFIGNEMYLHATHDGDEQHQNSSSANASPRGHQANPDKINSFSDSPVYRPPSTSYGITSHSSFKKPADNNQNGIKKQPRTQLAVPPCRPELPPRDPEQVRANINRPNGLTDHFDHMSPAVPKDKVRKVRSSPRRTISPPSFKQNHSTADYQWQKNLDALDNSKFNGSPAHRPFSENKIPSPGAVDLAGSMEKISRV